MLFGFACPKCGAEDLEADVIVDYGGSPGVFSLPELSSPGEGAEWHLAADVQCDECGEVITDDRLGELHEDRIQERIAEPADPY